MHFPYRFLASRCALLLLGWGLALPGAAWAASPGKTTYALIVANNASLDPKQAALRYADDDGARYYEFFAPQAQETVLLSVLDEETQGRHPGVASRARPPTRSALLEALRQLNTRMAADKAAGLTPVLYFIFTGHGQRGAAGEGSVNLLDGPFSRTDLYKHVIAPSTAGFLHLIVDACDSYFFVNSRGTLPVGPALGATVTQHLASRELERYPHVGVVLSTSKAQESHEWSAISSGVFSHQVRSALAGAADVNADGRVEYSELMAFIASASQGVEDVRGRLDIFARPPLLDRSAPLSDLAQKSGLGYLLIPEGVGGRMWVEDTRGVRLAEFHKERERALVLGLPVGRGYYLRIPGQEARFTLQRGREVVDAGALTWTALSVASRGALEDAFRDHLFGVAFGPRFYSGYVASAGMAPVPLYPGPDLSP
ncbi:caspase family protein [Stigmatella sp. ncwal1]|uniref:Caspase family protein n=1 Tax=Stigmatella ashevillensis TaxID=2995309 RepID=A0ABT5DCQ9_9BACT|nr:caspase family protein [Stigmatella ashevillena]MDC0710131.1 caspase family protein [Stigmatella ashevillena]